LTWWARVINRSIIALFAREHSGADRIGAGGYRADIDGLGAVAILSVVIYRAVKDVARGGFVGVDFFRYLRVPDQRHRSERHEFRNVIFCPGPIRRILPALIIVLAAIWAIGWFALGPDESLAPPDLGGRGVRVESRSDA
jgi:peptidoglycan/LPS O-acetylase OafA/YrhL